MSANHPYQELAAALRERLAAIADREHYARDAAGHLARLQAVSEKITVCAAALPRPVPGQLAHFLQSQSYQKALALLEREGVF